MRAKVGGAVLLAVCRGRLSEGVDFADSQCRAVVVTGLPLPPIYDPKVSLKREYLDRLRAQAVRGAAQGVVTLRAEAVGLQAAELAIHVK